jgi:hypothetical protein
MPISRLKAGGRPAYIFFAQAHPWHDEAVPPMAIHYFLPSSNHHRMQAGLVRHADILLAIVIAPNYLIVEALGAINTSSHAFDQRCQAAIGDARGLSGWMDGPAAIDVMRAVRLTQHGYRVWTQIIPAEITAKNRLLLGAPAPARREFKTAVI